jgi:hypothetical protein
LKETPVIADNKTETVELPAKKPVYIIERIIPENAPQDVREAVNKVLPDAVVGIGMAKMPNLAVSKTVARNYAFTDVVKQLNRITILLIQNFKGKETVNPDHEKTFHETLSVSLSKSTLNGVTFIYEAMDEYGNFWVVAQLNKNAVIEEFAAAQIDAKQAVPAMASFDAAELIKELDK